MSAGADRHRQHTSQVAAVMAGLLAGAGVCDASAHVAAGAAAVLDPAAMCCALSALVVLAACLVVRSVRSATQTVSDARRLVAAWRGRNR